MSDAGGLRMKQGLSVKCVLKRAEFTLDVEAELPDSGIMAIFGPSGSGKTSLLRCIAGLEAFRGRVTWRGAVWHDHVSRVAVHRRGVGFVFQDSRLFSHLNVRKNLSFGMSRRPRRLEIDVESVADWLELHPHLEKRVSELSAGERQRVAIGRALLAQPRLLLLDEPLSSLDEGRKRRIMPRLRTFARDHDLPMIWITHAMSEVLSTADDVLVMDAGSIRERGNPADVFTVRHDHLDAVGAPGAVLTAVVEEEEFEFGLTRMRVRDQVMYLPVRGAVPGSTVRVFIAAQNVSIGVGTPPQAISVLNILSGTVTSIWESPGDGHSVFVEIDVGIPVLASITRKSALRLGLEVGMPVHAYVKAMALMS